MIAPEATSAAARKTSCTAERFGRWARRQADALEKRLSFQRGDNVHERQSRLRLRHARRLARRRAGAGASCAGTSTVDYDAHRWKYVAKGTCESMITPKGHGMLTAM
ncbi:MAG: DUF2282 domain-containing protein [Roseiarcus sp.]